MFVFYALFSNGDGDSTIAVLDPIGDRDTLLDIWPLERSESLWMVPGTVDPSANPCEAVRRDRES